MIPYILTNDSLTVIINGKSLTMNRDNPSFRSATRALQDEDYEKVEQMFDIPKAVVNFAEGNVSVKDGVVTYKGEEVHNRLPGSRALGLAAADQGIHMLRAHDVAETKQAFSLRESVLDAI